MELTRTTETYEAAQVTVQYEDDERPGTVALTDVDFTEPEPAAYLAWLTAKVVAKLKATGTPRKPERYAALDPKDVRVREAPKREPEPEPIEPLPDEPVPVEPTVPVRER